MLDQATTLGGGFADPVTDAQATFRTLMDAMARPARIVPLTARATPPAPLGALAGAIACALVDADTPVWLDPVLGGSEAVRAWLAFHTGARVTASPADAAFAIVSDVARMPPFERFAQGTQDYPDRSATLILELERLHGGPGVTFEGPGIKGKARFAPSGLPDDFMRQWVANSRRFPRGVDLILTSADAVACLPRSARLAQTEG